MIEKQDIHSDQVNPWKQFLDKIKDYVDDALVVYKGNNDDDKNDKCGIYAQVKDDDIKIKMHPNLDQIVKWIQLFDSIKKKTHPSSPIECWIEYEGEKELKNFHIIEYGENFVRAHLSNNNDRECLFFSQSNSYIFVGYCFNKLKIQTPSQTFFAVESLARFVRDCEHYNKMEILHENS